MAVNEQRRCGRSDPADLRGSLGSSQLLSYAEETLADRYCTYEPPIESALKCCSARIDNRVVIVLDVD